MEATILLEDGAASLPCIVLSRSEQGAVIRLANDASIMANSFRLVFDDEESHSCWVMRREGCDATVIFVED